MKLSSQARWVIALAPAILTILLFFLLAISPNVKRSASMREEIGYLTSISAERQARVAQLNEEQRRLSEQLNAMQTEMAGKDNKMNMATNRMTMCRATTVRSLSRMCNNAELTLLSIAPASNREVLHRRVDPVAMAELLTKAGWGGAETWQLHLRGTFPNMLKLLENMVKSEALIMPAGIGMAATSDEALANEWYLTIWI